MIDPVTGWFEIAQYDDKKSDIFHEHNWNYVAV